MNVDLVEQGQAFTRIVAKCRVDSDYKQSLINDPVAVFREGGMHVPDGLRIEFVPSGQDVPASTQEVVYLSVEVLERDFEPLTEETLNTIAAGLKNDWDRPDWRYCGFSADASLALCGSIMC
jgi:hypothetical protein